MPHTIINKGGSHTDEDFWTQYKSVNPRMCTIFQVTPVGVWGGSASAVGFTSNTRNMTLPNHSITFKSSPSVEPTTVENKLDEPSNLELTGIFNSDSFTEDDVLAGKWNFSEFKIFVVCWDFDVSDATTYLGEWVVHRGFLSDFKSYQDYFKTESRGLLSLLENEVHETIGDVCRVPFRSTKCGHVASTIELDAVTYNVEHDLTVSSVISSHQIIFYTLAGAANDVPDGFFDHGKITALGSTANGSISREIKTSSNDGSNITIDLKRRFPFPVEDAQEFRLVLGCNKTIEACMLRGRIVDRRAEDFVPTAEEVGRIPPAS